jgi:hypothetical protein
MADPHPPRPPIDWEAIVGELTKYGRNVVDRVGCGLEASARDAKNGTYTADRLLDDINAFWQELAKDVDLGIKNWKKYVEHRGDVV